MPLNISQCTKFKILMGVLLVSIGITLKQTCYILAPLLIHILQKETNKTKQTKMLFSGTDLALASVDAIGHLYEQHIEGMFLWPSQQ